MSSSYRYLETFLLRLHSAVYASITQCVVHCSFIRRNIVEKYRVFVCNCYGNLDVNWSIYHRFHFIGESIGNDRIVQNKCEQLYRWRKQRVSMNSRTEPLRCLRWKHQDLECLSCGRFCDPFKLTMSKRPNRIASCYLRMEFKSQMSDISVHWKL